jgi:uncharacterized Ntn-hydrolase superfamily protein
MRRGTYSIVARDPGTGCFGAAVQSHWFSVGSIVIWAEPGVGAVATQSVAEPAYGPRLLARLGAGAEPQAALDDLLAADAEAGFRQVAVIGATGDAGVHTGEGCIAYAGHRIGDGFSAQANMMASPEVWPAMAEAFEAASGPLERRLLAALEAAEGAGGDVRGRQSAALTVVPANGESWQRVVELRVEDDPEPLRELSRLLDLHDAYGEASAGDELAAAGDHDAAGSRYRRAAELAPGNHELLFWSGLSLFAGGETGEGLEALREAIRLQPGWAELLPRLSEEIAPGAARAAGELGLTAEPG